MKASSPRGSDDDLFTGIAEETEKLAIRWLPKVRTFNARPDDLEWSEQARAVLTRRVESFWPDFVTAAPEPPVLSWAEMRAMLGALEPPTYVMLVAPDQVERVRGALAEAIAAERDPWMVFALERVKVKPSLYLHLEPNEALVLNPPKWDEKVRIR